MKKRRNSTIRVKPPTITRQAPLQYNKPSFHETFPIKLTHPEHGNEKVCYFMCKEHLQSYIIRNKLKKNQVKIEKTPIKKEEN